jgi:ribonucleotide reductase alpha subunit
MHSKNNCIPPQVCYLDGSNGYDPAKRYTQAEIDELVAKSPYYKATSNDVDWLMKVKMQGRIQKWLTTQSA